MLFLAVLANIPNSNVCLKGESPLSFVPYYNNTHFNQDILSLKFSQRIQHLFVVLDRLDPNKNDRKHHSGDHAGKSS